MELASKIKENVNKVIVGKDKQIEQLLVALVVGGHVLLEDVPGTGKTKTARSLAQSLNLDFKRVQFTIDLLPSDLTGINYFDRNQDQSSRTSFLQTRSTEQRQGPSQAFSSVWRKSRSPLTVRHASSLLRSW